MSRNKEKYPPDGRLHTCKKCLTMHVDNWDPETFKWILEELDVPYIKEAWDDVLAKQLERTPIEKLTGLSVMGRYVSKMKLKQYRDYRWEDTEQIEQQKTDEKIHQMQAQGLTEEEIQDQLAIDRSIKRPNIPVHAVEASENFEDSQFEEENDEFADELTEEDKTYLRLKWGRSYKPYEWVRLEQLYNDMMNSYDIQSAGHKDTLIMLCKASLKANQLIDAGDIDDFQKMSKVYDALMKSGRFEMWTMKNFSSYHWGFKYLI